VCRRAAEQRDELAALQLTELHSAALSQSGSIADWRPLSQGLLRWRMRSSNIRVGLGIVRKEAA